MDLVQFRSDIEFDELNNPSTNCSTNGGSIVNPLLTDIENLVNKGWETAACLPEFDLCPLEPVFSGKISLGCSADGTDGVLLSGECTELSDAIYPACDGFYVETTIDSIDGLKNLVFDSFMVTDIDGANGTQPCPYDENANGGSFQCSYHGQGTGSASLKSGTELKLVDSDFEVKLKCSGLFGSKTYTLYHGNFTCTTSNPTATSTYNFCAGGCESNLDGVMTYLKIPSKSSLKLHSGDLKCDFEPPTNPVNWFLDAFVPLFEEQIAKAVREPIVGVLNDLIPPMPYPNSCSN